MSAPVKFLFEDDFAGGASPTGPKSTGPLAVHEAALAAQDALRERAEANAYRNGMAAAEANIEGRAADACQRIAQGIAALKQSLHAIEARLEAEAVEVAVAVARKLAPELIA